MGKQRTSITLAEDLLGFADNEVAAGRADSRSEVIERALRAYRKVLWNKAAREAASDPEYRRQLREWDSTLADGLPDEDFSDWWGKTGEGGDDEAAA